jgi:hypothetical protein
LDYKEWAATPEGKAAIDAAMLRASNELQAYRDKLKADNEQALNKYILDSHNRMIDEGLVKRCTAIDDQFTAELPLDIGYMRTDEAIELCWVSLGGHDVTDYLPPDVMADIKSHLEFKEFDE